MSTVTRHNKCTLPTLALRSVVQWVRDVCAVPPAIWETTFKSFVTFLLYFKLKKKGSLFRYKPLHYIIKLT